MDAPRVEGLKILDLVGSGPCGNVYLAQDESDALLAVKFFHAMAINRPLLMKAVARLEAAGWPAGVMPVISSDFEARPARLVMPWFAVTMADGQATPRNLQTRIADFPGDHSWPVVLKLAKVLATFHDLRVAHGNLKPGNVFFDDAEQVIVTDWAQGNMPGVSPADYTDAYLYQAPEQLRQPQGYLDEAGYRWDVFSFGVLAYRLLTGLFPRCDEIFSRVAPAAGEIRKEGIHADVQKIARNLESQGEIVWPDEAANPVEAGYREWILKCLSLDPAQRPATMAEVSRGLKQVNERIAAESQRTELSDQRQRAEHRSSRALFTSGIIATLALLLGGLWQLALFRYKNDRKSHAEEICGLKSQADAAVTAREDAMKSAAIARHDLEYERDVGQARLEASRAIGDHLFDWAMEKGHRRLPPLDGRERRLLRLERYFDDFLLTADAKSLDDERARIKLQLAEICLARGDAEVAATRLAEALEVWKTRAADTTWKLRIASDRLLLALLLQTKNDPGTATAFTESREALTKVPQADVDVDRLQQLLAILDFHEAQLLAEQGHDAKALEQLMRATQSLNKLADQRPDAAVLRSELANCYLSSATILEGIGSLGDAREVRTLAAAQLVKLLKDKPTDAALRLDLAGCYGAMAEAAVLSGDVASAEDLSTQATGLLELLLREQPDNSEAVSRLGAQRWIRAGLLRDRGKAAEALKLADDGIRMLEGTHASDPGNGTVCYRLALLWWQKGRMLGAAGDRGQEMLLLVKARELLVMLEERTEYGLSRSYQLKKSLGYLLGDLGHAQGLASKSDESKKTFEQAVSVWEALSKSQPQSEEAEEALSWCRQRLREIQ